MICSTRIKYKYIPKTVIEGKTNYTNDSYANDSYLTDRSIRI